MRVAGIAVTLAALAAASPASAETFVVDSLKDAVDPEPTNDVCATAAGECTLRAAIETANHFVGNDEITLPKGTIKLTIPKAGSTQDNNEGELDVTEAVEIDGRGPDEDRDQADGQRPRAAKRRGRSADSCSPGLQLSDVDPHRGTNRRAPARTVAPGFRTTRSRSSPTSSIKKNVVNSDSSDNVPGGGILTSGVLAMAETTVRGNVARGRGDTLTQAAGMFVHNGSATIQDGSKVVSNSVQFRDPEGIDALPRAAGSCRGEPRKRAHRHGLHHRQHGRRKHRLGRRALGWRRASSPGSGANLDIQRSTVSGNRSKRGGGLYLVGLSDGHDHQLHDQRQLRHRPGRGRDLPPGRGRRHRRLADHDRRQRPVGGAPRHRGRRAGGDRRRSACSPRSSSTPARSAAHPSRPARPSATAGGTSSATSPVPSARRTSTSRPTPTSGRWRTTADRRRPTPSRPRVPRSTACHAARVSTSAGFLARSEPTATRAPSSVSSRRRGAGASGAWRAVR